MNIEELSNNFDVEIASQTIVLQFGKTTSDFAFNEYEKSVWLTKAQEQIVTEWYNGVNAKQESFEATEEARGYIRPLLTTVECERIDNPSSSLLDSSKVFSRPGDVMFIIYENVKFDDESLGCKNGTVADVYPVKHDEFLKIRRNPFRNSNARRVLRLDSDNNTSELITKYQIGKYVMRYVRKPKPIILVDLDEPLSIDGCSRIHGCELDDHVHNIILTRAVQLAINSKIKFLKSSSDKE